MDTTTFEIPKGYDTGKAELITDENGKPKRIVFELIERDKLTRKPLQYTKKNQVITRLFGRYKNVQNKGIDQVITECDQAVEAILQKKELTEYQLNVKRRLGL